MNTPIADFIDRYIESDTVRFHMPGHKGKGSIEKYDITEIDGADVLYSADGIINESENNASSLFCTAHTFYSTEGSTLAIKAMLTIATKGKNRKILAARNVHKAFIYGCALLDLYVEWLLPEKFSHLCSCIIDAEDVERTLSNMEELPCAVYITSPDYLGNIADIEGIANVCKSYGVPLLVDNAHGAYLKFLSPFIHPMDLGAAMCTDSAHKTLPVLTGGAYLHISKDFPNFANNARSALSLFASTSPSYLIMRSLDTCNRHLAESFSKELCDCIERTAAAKAKLITMGYTVMDTEPLKIVIDAKKSGYRGDSLGDILRECGIECEFCDCDYTVIMTSPKNCESDFEKLIIALGNVIQKDHIADTDFAISGISQVMSIREAIFADSERVSTDNALERICASPTVSCPPAVPIVISGERIDSNHIELLKHYGIETVEVVKE